MLHARRSSPGTWRGSCGAWRGSSNARRPGRCAAEGSPGVPQGTFGASRATARARRGASGVSCVSPASPRARPMPRAAPMPANVLMMNARDALKMTQREFADATGTSLRTVSRWEAGESTPSFIELRKVAPVLHPRDADLAREAARMGGTTLEALGVVRPPAPPEPPPAPPPASPAKEVAPPPPPPPERPTRLLVDAVVYAAAEALEASPGSLLRNARAMVAAAFARARDLGLSSEQVAEAFVVPAPPVAESGPSSKSRPRSSR